MNIDVVGLIKSDLYRYYGRTDRRSFVSAFRKSPGFRYSYYMRKAGSYSQRRGILATIGFAYNKVMQNRYRFRYGFEISHLTRIGPGLFLGHFGGVVINPQAVIGTNVNIAPGVTIGQTNRGHNKGVPVIGDRVWIGTHAVIVGAISIGNDSLIGPGAYVNFDVPAGAVVLGNPGKVVSYLGSAGYIERMVTDSTPAPDLPGCRATR